MAFVISGELKLFCSLGIYILQIVSSSVSAAAKGRAHGCMDFIGLFCIKTADLAQPRNHSMVTRPFFLVRRWDLGMRLDNADCSPRDSHSVGKVKHE